MKNYTKQYSSFLWVILVGIISTLILFATTFLDSIYLITYIFLGILGFIFLLIKDKFLVFAWGILFFTAFNRTKGLAYSPYLIDEPVGISLFWVFLVFCVSVLFLCKKKIQERTQNLTSLIVIYCCYLGINTIVSLRYALIKSFSLYAIIGYFSFILIILFWERIGENIPDRKLYKYILILFLIGAVEGIFAMAQVIFNINLNFWSQTTNPQISLTGVSRAIGSLGGYTALGNYLAILFPFIVSIFFYKKTSGKLICIILTGIGLCLTFTRAAWLGAFIATGLVIGILFKRIKLSGGRLLSYGIIALILFIIILLPYYSKIVEATDHLLIRRGNTFSARIDTYRIAWEIIRNSNFIGIGTENYESLLFKNYFNSSSWISEVHNSYLLVLAESGILGLFFFLATYIYSLLFGSKIAKYLNPGSLAFYTTVGMLGSIISFLVCSFLNMTNTYESAMNLLWNIIAIGLISGISGYRKQTTPQSLTYS